LCFRRKRFIHASAQIARQCHIPLLNRHDWLIQNHINRVTLLCERIREGSGEHEVESGGDAPDIGDGLHVFEIDELLAGHEQRGAGVVAGDAEAAETCLLEVLGEAKVGDAGDATIQEDVLRLEVAVDDAELVRMRETLQRGEHDGLGEFERELAPVFHDQVPQAAAFAVLHDEPRQTFAVALIEKLDDVWVTKLGGDGHLAEEFLDLDWRNGNSGQHDFNGDGDAIGQTAGAEDDTKAATAKLFLNNISGNVEGGALPAFAAFKSKSASCFGLRSSRPGDGGRGGGPAAGFFACWMDTSKAVSPT
jgi:hypothetical protein